MELKTEQMKNIFGGAIASSMINAVTKAINAIYELGKQTGSALRRIFTNGYCSVR